MAFRLLQQTTGVAPKKILKEDLCQIQNQR